MHLVQFLLPLAGNDGRPFARHLFAQIEAELTEAFGGVTAHLGAPARGTWQAASSDADTPDADAPGVAVDRVVLFEVLCDRLDRAWWARYRADLEARFQQDEVLIRALPAERL